MDELENNEVQPEVPEPVEGEQDAPETDVVTKEGAEQTQETTPASGIPGLPFQTVDELAKGYKESQAYGTRTNQALIEANQLNQRLVALLEQRSAGAESKQDEPIDPADELEQVAAVIAEKYPDEPEMAAAFRINARVAKQARADAKAARDAAQQSGDLEGYRNADELRVGLADFHKEFSDVLKNPEIGRIADEDFAERMGEFFPGKTPAEISVEMERLFAAIGSGAAIPLNKRFAQELPKRMRKSVLFATATARVKIAEKKAGAAATVDARKQTLGTSATPPVAQNPSNGKRLSYEEAKRLCGL
jgi:hypothetical protein